MTAPSPAFETGTILDVEQVTLGSELAADAALGAVSLTIVDASDLDAEDGGTVAINGAQYVYTVTDVDNGVVTVTPGLTAAAVTGDRVDVWDTVANVAGSYFEALVQLPGTEDVDATPARLASALVPTFTHKLGIRDAGTGEACTMQLQGDEWVVVEVQGDTVQLDGAAIKPATIGQAALGFTLTDGTKVTVSTTAPTPAVAGDLWVDAGHGNVLNQFDGTTWQSVQDAAIAAAQAAASAAQTAASAAQTTANGRNTIFRQGTAPTAHAAGDVWFDTANGNRVSVWDGSTWQTSQLQGVAVGNLDAGAITTGSLAAARIAAGSLDASKITAGSITGDRLAVGTITGDRIAAGSIVAGQIAAGALDAFAIKAASLSAVTMSGHLTGSTVSGSDVLIDSDQGRILVYQQTAAAVVTAPTTPGTYTYTVPSTGGITTVKLEGWGAGGGGGFGSALGATVNTGAGGGGEYAAEPSFPVNPGDVITYTIPPASVSQGNGADAVVKINGVEVLRAHGGKNGNTIDGPGRGGTGSANTVHFDGGAGGKLSGAGGGSSAGPKSAGNNGNNGGGTGGAGAPGGAAPFGGGAGGNGATGTATTPPAGSPGAAPGGGGGAGGYSNAGNSSAGGAGGPGQVQLTTYASTLVASLAAVTGTTDPYNPSKTIPLGLKMQRQDLTGVLGGYATERTYQFNNLASSVNYTFTGNGSIVEQLSDYGGPFNSGVFTAPVNAFYDANMFVTGASQSSVTIDRSTDSGTTWTTRFANTSPGTPQNVSCGGPLWLNAGDKVRFGVRQNSGAAATVSGNFFIGVRA